MKKNKRQNVQQAATSISQAHDKIAKKTLSNVKLAKKFFQTYLPETIQAIIHLDSLKVQKGDFIDEALKEYRTDLLYRVNFKNNKPGYIYTLLENQSTVDPLMAFRLLRYSVQIMGHHLEHHKT